MRVLSSWWNLPGDIKEVTTIRSKAKRRKVRRLMAEDQWRMGCLANGGFLPCGVRNRGISDFRASAFLPIQVGFCDEGSLDSIVGMQHEPHSGALPGCATPRLALASVILAYFTDNLNNIPLKTFFLSTYI